jgi:nitroreductase
MELRDALRTTSAVRAFTDEPVSNATLTAILDDARFAPSGGNRQPWHVIVIGDRATKEALAALYLDAWHDYVAHLLAGLVPYSPIATAQDRALAAAQRDAAVARSDPDGFPERIADVPCLLVVTANLGVLAALDRDLPRYGLVGGASVYPFVWQILLAAHERGLGGVMTTMVARFEPAARDLLAIPTTHAFASLIALGRPTAPLTKLRRGSVSSFTTIDAFNGPPLGG